MISLMVLATFSIPIRTSILDNSSREKNMAKETISSAKELFSVDDGRMTLKYKANNPSLTVMSSMASSKTTNVIKVNTDTEMETYMKEHGRMRLKTVMEGFILKMAKDMKDSL